MKLLYAAFRNDPLKLASASGADYQFYHALCKAGMDVRVVGPFQKPSIPFERILKRLVRQHTTTRYIKYDVTATFRASRAVNAAVEQERPHVIFSLYPPTIAFLKSKAPCVIRTDTTFLGMQMQGADFLRHGKLALACMVWLERRAFRKCAAVITHSEWSKGILEREYDLPSRRVFVFPNPAALPGGVVPRTVNIEAKKVEFPIRLLLVGRDFRRKGVDIALMIVRHLNQMRVPVELTICGTERRNGGEEERYVTYAGYFDKTIPQQLQEYVSLYENAHLLLHPVRFDASPIVTSEAAALGTPTVTNDVGGMATSVKDGESGIVLPRASSPEVYAQAIAGLMRNPDRYYELCHRTRQRYERELNWNVAGSRLAEIIREIVPQQWGCVARHE